MNWLNALILGVSGSLIAAFICWLVKPIRFFILARWEKLRDASSNKAKTRVCRNFGKYCQACTKLITEAKEFVYTVQTPVVSLEQDQAHNSGDDSDFDRRAYKAYIDATITTVLKNEIRYQRIVVLDRTKQKAAIPSQENDPVSRIVDFVTELVQAAWDSKCGSIDAGIRFVLTPTPDPSDHRTVKSGLGLIHSNIDFTLTDAKEFSLAFVKTTSRFGGSVHLLDGTDYVRKTLRDEIRASWEGIEDAHRIEMSEFVPRIPPKSYGERQVILDSLTSKIRKIVDDLTNPPPDGEFGKAVASH